MNVFDLPGAEFLKLYLVLLAGGVLLLVVFRYLLRGPFDEAPAALRLSAEEVAFLAGGRRGTVDAAVAALAHRGVLKVRLARDKPTLKAIRPAPLEVTEVENDVYDAVLGSRGSDALLGPVRRAAANAADAVGDRLRDLELVLTESRRAAVRFLPALPLALCLAVGGQKLIIGLSRGRPVMFLVILLFITLGGLLVALFNYPHRTRRGDRVLKDLKRSNASLQITSLAQLAPADLVMAYALFGPGVLAMGPDTDLYNTMKRQTHVSSCGGGSCGSSSCGGGCGGGGCGGCGGCGG